MQENHHLFHDQGILGTNAIRKSGRWCDFKQLHKPDNSIKANNSIETLPLIATMSQVKVQELLKQLKSLQNGSADVLKPTNAAIASRNQIGCQADY